MIKKILGSFLFVLVLLFINLLSLNIASAATCTNLISDLSIGSLDTHYTTPDVTRLQAFLISRGLLNTTSNGIFGPQTQAAVKYFQKSNGLEVTGFVGSLTRGKIKDISCAIIAGSDASGMPIRDFISLLINADIIKADRIPVINIFLTNLKLLPISVPTIIGISTVAGSTTTSTTTPVVAVVGSGGGGGSSSSRTYTVTYDGNGSATGTAPVEATRYSRNESFVAKDNSGSLSRVSYGFIGWNTVADGSGQSMIPGSSYSIGSSNITLYAQWATVFHGGDGSIDNPFQINNWSELNQIRDNLSANYVLTADLSSTTTGYSGIGDAWVPIGNCGPGNECGSGDFSYLFSGNFDGNNKTISNLTINLPSNFNVGLFGYTSGDISNIGVVDVNILGDGSVGSIIGHIKSGTLSKSYSTGNVNGDSNIGGLVGYLSSGTIINSYTTASASGTSVVGGLISQRISGSIINSYSVGSVSASFSLSGGLVANGDEGTTTSSYWDIEASGQATSTSGVGTTTVGMKKPVTYVGWSVTPGAQDLNNGYPYLGWQVDNDIDTWIMPGKTISYDANGGTGPTQVSSVYFVGSTTTVAGVGSLTKDGYIFNGWNTQADGLGDSYATSSEITITDNVTLYAQWSYVGALITNPTWAVSGDGTVVDFLFTLEAQNEDISVLTSSIASSTAGTASISAGVLSRVSGDTVETISGGFTVAEGDTVNFRVRYALSGSNGSWKEITITSVAGETIPVDDQTSPTATINL